MNEQLCQAAVEQSNQGICAIQDGKLTAANSRLQELTGYTESELQGEPLRKIVSSTHQESIPTSENAISNGDSSSQYAIKLETKTGSLLPVELSVNEINHEGQPTLVAAVRKPEQTHNRELHDDTETPVEEYETIFENTQDAIFLLDVDSDGTIRYNRFNHREEQFTGTSSAEVSGKTPIEAFGEELGEELESNYSKCLEAESTLCYEETFNLNDETTVWQTQLTPVSIKGEVKHIVGTGREITELRESQREINRKNTLLEQAQDAADLGAWELDMRDGELWWSQKVDEIYGFPTDDILQPDDAFDYFHPADRPVISAAFDRLREAGSPYDLELRLIDEQDTEKWVRSIGRPSVDNGEIVTVQGTFQDITERKEREHELQDLTERLELAVNGANLGVWDWNPQTDQVQFNENWATMLGYGPDEIDSELAEWEQRVHPDDIDSVETALKAHLEGESDYYDTEHRMRTADGEWNWIRDVGRVFERGKAGHPTRVVGVHIDITERKEYEARVEQARTQLRQIIDLVPDPIYLKNQDGEYLLANEATAEIYGLTPTEVEGSKDGELIAEIEDASVFREDSRPVIESGDSETMPETELTTAAGETKFLQTTKIPCETFDSGDDAVLEYARDVTEPKNYEQMLERQRDDLRLLNEVVRHDIRNHLQVVLGCLEILEEYVEHGGEHHITEALQSAHSAVDVTATARELTASLLQEDKKRVPVDLRHVLTTEIERVRSSNQQAVVAIEGRLPQIDVLADKLLGSAFRNLLTNATIHNDKETPTVNVSATVADESVYVKIADNGLGVADERKENIFTRNERGIETGGTGLGLYLVQTLVDRYKGEIMLEDNEPDGSVFTVKLQTFDEQT